MLAFGTTARAETLLFDFADSLGSGGPGGTWNVYGAPAEVSAATVLENSTGATSAIRMSFAGNLSESANTGTANVFDNNAAGLEGQPSWAASTTNNNAAGDIFFTSNASDGQIHTVTFTVTNLTAGGRVSIDLLAARNTGVADGFYEYSIDGATFQGFNVLNADGTPATANNWGSNTTQSQAFDNDVDGSDNHRYMNINEVTLPGTSMRIRVTDISNANSNFAAINAMRLTVVPEPATIGLLAAGMGLLVLRRKRRRALRWGQAVAS